ncbi:MAG: hypothetical protein COU08_00880 [Candidatus Harrisonbacteria bacterium CG10_big_fil_rev_8_21_14_0_10_42_17]|uniref:NYN domain-containing protein n=1 Tax=Candidatus Harrisonbacteria bacterium CG10_big_fil_rev_8_21_14_0_10_42_17 TaxID=1974584 RepID=A0A2M6WIT3_9BACT|nr:MAG: hypothetical protein COU08_00880 [Candidatus Harrisonbacteria bacterium CG10_big_fil_rev_8_21_14_0_10_42_17]
MISQHKDQRVGIFIDIQNLYHSSKNLFSSRVNYKELINNITAGRKLIRAIGYVVKTETSFGESSFFEALGQAGIQLRVKDIQINPDGSKKADWDIGMAIDAISTGGLDVVVLVTGDGDFIPAVHYLKWGLGRSVEVAGFSRTTSGKLKESADYFHPIEEFPKILLNKKPTARRTRKSPPKSL